MWRRSIMTKKNIQEEDLLLKAAALGNANAFEKLYDSYHNSILKFAITFLKSADLAEDTTQEVFIKIWDKREDLQNVNSFKDYLFITARNHIYNVIKKIARENNFKSALLSNYKVEPGTAEDSLVDKDYQEFIEKVLNNLPPQTREVFQLCRNQNKTYEEVAEQLGISRNTVKKHMVRSHKAFTDSINQNPDIILTTLVILFLENFINNF